VKANAIFALLENGVQRDPNHGCLLADDGGPWLSYRAVQDAVLSSIRGLESSGVQAGDRVAIQMERPDRFVLAWLAVLSMNAVAVPLDCQAPSSDRARVLTLTGARWLIHDGREGEPPLPWGSIVGDGAHWRLQRPPQGARWARRCESGGLILLTSGTTGDPKPVGLPTLALTHTASHIAAVHQLSDQDVGYSPLPLFHINGEVVGVLSSLLVGAAVIVSHRFHAGRFWLVANRENATWLNLVPSILKVLLAGDGGPRQGGRIRFIRSASAPLPASTLAALTERWHIPVVETYGMSEAASQIAANPLEGSRPGSVGEPVGTEVRIVDECGMVAPVGQIGEVEIRGPAVIEPGWGPNRWALERYHRGWYRTGDLGCFNAEGYLYLHGRLRELINRGGEKIFPREVEEILLEHPALLDCAVVGRPHHLLGEEPVAFVVPRHPAHDPVRLEQELIRMTMTRLSRFKCPVQYFVVNTLPRGATGKISKQSLRERAVGNASMFS